MGLLARIKNKITKRTTEEPSITNDEIDKFINDLNSASTVSEPYAGQYGFLEGLLSRSPGAFGNPLCGSGQSFHPTALQAQQYQAIMARQQAAMPMPSQMGMAAMPALGTCQPTRPGRKHVDYHIVEPKGLPENTKAPAVEDAQGAHEREQL